jgi:hypothetical protein
MTKHERKLTIVALAGVRLFFFWTNPFRRVLLQEIGP